MAHTTALAGGCNTLGTTISAGDTNSPTPGDLRYPGTMADASSTNETPKPGRGSWTGDVLLNLALGVGTPGDRLTKTRHVLPARIMRDEFDALYTGDWLSAAMIDAIPDDMTREWRDITGIGDDRLEAYSIAEKLWNIKRECRRGLKWSRLYGGAGIIMGLDGTGEFHEPLDIERVRKGSLQYLTTLDRWNLIPMDVSTYNPLTSEFGKPEFYRAFGGADLIHRSRIVFFYGIDLPYHLAIRELFWGGSILTRVLDAVNNAGIVQHGAAALVTEAKVDVWKIPDLMSQLETEEGTKTIHDRIELAQQIKGIYNAIIMDQAEDWEQKTGLLQGLRPEIVMTFLEIAAAASSIPVTRLLGQSPKGLNATGEENTRNYYDRVKSAQTDQLEPALAVLDQVLMRSTFGQMPDEFSSTFTNLWMESETERSTTQAQDTTRDLSLLTEGVIQEHHIAARILAENYYPTYEEKDVRQLREIGTYEPPRPDPFAPGAPGLPGGPGSPPDIPGGGPGGDPDGQNGE